MKYQQFLLNKTGSKCKQIGWYYETNIWEWYIFQIYYTLDEMELFFSQG